MSRSRLSRYTRETTSVEDANTANTHLPELSDDDFPSLEAIEADMAAMDDFDTVMDVNYQLIERQLKATHQQLKEAQENVSQESAGDAGIIALAIGAVIALVIAALKKLASLFDKNKIENHERRANTIVRNRELSSRLLEHKGGDKLVKRLEYQVGNEMTQLQYQVLFAPKDFMLVLFRQNKVLFHDLLDHIARASQVAHDQLQDEAAPGDLEKVDTELEELRGHYHDVVKSMMGDWGDKNHDGSLLEYVNRIQQAVNDTRNAKVTVDWTNLVKGGDLTSYGLYYAMGGNILLDSQEKRKFENVSDLTSKLFNRIKDEKLAFAESMSDDQRILYNEQIKSLIVTVSHGVTQLKKIVQMRQSLVDTESAMMNQIRKVLDSA